jgi:SAM-dependent methyltransferase
LKPLAHNPVAATAMTNDAANGAASGTARSRAFEWISSVDGNVARLNDLDRAMAGFYSQRSSRQIYQTMIDAEESSQPETEDALRSAILRRAPRSILEIGCGSGRILRQLRHDGFCDEYTGIEMSAELIEANRKRHPGERWQVGSIYTADLPSGTFDVVFAFFVLEHCVFPERALNRMATLVRPGGSILLVFPDFPAMGILASQTLGFVDGRAGECLRRGDLFNALFNLYESRIRLPRALRRAVTDCGPFPVNVRPRCLTDAQHLVPDVDAVYIASKTEVADWGRQRGMTIEFPAGTDGNFRENALIRLGRPEGVSFGDSRPVV